MSHADYMQRAMTLAQKASGSTSPNPLVGCVIVNDKVIVGEGWHHRAGQPHAEIEALREAGEKARGATLYVNLEPCTHHGRTPPCTDAIIQAGIKSVVIAALENNPEAQGGQSVLESHGITVVTGVCENEARQLNRFFYHFNATGRPYTIAKFASSLDGRIATRTRNSQWITGEKARHRGHHLRQAVDAILVGTQTVVDDDPQLTVRNHSNGQNEINHPLRVVVDAQGRIPLERKVFSTELPGSTLVITTDRMNTERRDRLSAADIDIAVIPAQSGSKLVSTGEILRVLAERNVQSLMIEGGQSLLGSFLDDNTIDEVWAFIAPMLIGGCDALSPVGGLGIDKLADARRLVNVRTELLDTDLLIAGQINRQLVGTSSVQVKGAT